MSNYRTRSQDDARDTVSEFRETIIELMLANGKASDDLYNDYPSGDSYHYESHVSRAYNLLDAATLLDELAYAEETDYGLWEGQDPRQAVSTQAAFTYGNAVMSEWQDFIAELNDLYDDWSCDWDDAEEERQAELEGAALETAEDTANDRKSDDLGTILDCWISEEL